MKKKLIVLSGFVLGLAPVAVLAQVAGTTGGTTNTGGQPVVCTSAAITDIQGILCKLNNIFGAVLPVLIGLGIIFFVWGVISYVVAGDEEAKTKGRDRMIYGVIGLAVIVGVWGLVAILNNSFGLNNAQSITLPTVPY